MSQSDVATGRGDVVRGRNRTTWRPAPLTVRVAGYLLFADATLTIAAAVAVAGPTVLSRLTGLEMLPGTSAQAPMVWEVAFPSVIGATIGLAFAGVEVACGLLLRRTLWWSRFALSGLVVVAFALALVPGGVGMAFHFSAWAGTLPGVKHVLLAAALLLVWLPMASRESFRRLASRPEAAARVGSAQAGSAQPASAPESTSGSPSAEPTPVRPDAPAGTAAPVEPPAPTELAGGGSPR